MWNNAIWQKQGKIEESFMTDDMVKNIKKNIHKKTQKNKFNLH